MKLSELKEDFDWFKIIFDAHAKFMSEEGMVLVPRESYDIVLCKSIRALSDAIQQIEQLEEENERLKAATERLSAEDVRAGLALGWATGLRDKMKAYADTLEAK